MPLVQKYDFNQEEQQRGGDGAIPDGSMVLVKLILRNPKEGRETDHPLITRLSSGVYALDAEYEVMAGSFKGLRLWEFIFLPASMQDVAMEEGQLRQCKTGGRKLRAIIEASCNIMPDDTSERAKHARNIEWEQLAAHPFPVKIGIKAPQPGERFINNNVRRIVTPDRKEYAELMKGKEFLTDKPLPDLIPVPEDMPY